MTNQKHKKIFRVFNPGKDFPAISLTGQDCALDCAHCGGKYLEHMIPVSTPAELLKKLNSLAAAGAKGALLSGGCDRYGQVDMENYLDTIAEIKKHTSLILNIHTGLINDHQIKGLAKTGADIASVDIVGDFVTIQAVYGLKHKPEQYQKELKTLKRSGIKSIVPHICIGLNFGRIKGEFNAIDIITCIEPTAIVFIILIPTKGSKMAGCEPPEIADVEKVLNYARGKFKTTPLYLGCMRPRSNKYRGYTQELERRAIQAGINGIVLPAKSTIDYLKHQKIPIKMFRTCCAVV